jgi:hypothetical protein
LPQEPRLRANLIKLFDLYATHLGMQMSTLGAKFYGDARLYDRLKTGSAFSVRAYDKVVANFRHVWPMSLEWPEEIEPVLKKDLPVRAVRKRPSNKSAAA